ncbi:MAG: TonB-dependent hemoglobin/transferrin/lactoferrin family receptor [Endozoicomonas sp.]
MNPALIRKSSLAVAIAAILSTNASATAVAQNAPKTTQPTLMNQVTVTATRTERQLDDVASSVSVVTAEDAEKNMVTNIRDLVKYEPGVDVTNDSRFGLGSFNVRGMDQNRVKITVDGVDQAKAFGYEKFIQSQRNFFDIENMKALEVVKGPASTLHGSDAIGGVVAFVTKDPADYLKPEGDDSYASVKAGYNSADSSHNESVTLANRSGDWESMLIYTRRDGKEQETYGGRGGTGDAREKADPVKYSSDSILGKLQYQVNDDHRIGLTGEWQNNKSKSDLYSADGKEMGANFGGMDGVVRYDDNRSDDRSERQRIGFSHEWQADYTAFDELNWSLNWQKSKSLQKTYDKMTTSVTVPPVLPPLPPVTFENYQSRLKSYVYEEESIQFDLALNKAFELENTSHFVTYGLSYEDKDQENLNKTHYLEVGGVIPGMPMPDEGQVDISRYAPLSNVKTYGLFLQDEIGLMNDRLVVTPGIRYDRFETNTKSDEYYKEEVEDKSYDSWTARLGGVFKIDDTWSTFAQYSQGFSTPDMFAMYFDYENPFAKVVSNPNLKPEESDSFEVGLRADSNLGSMELTAFYNDYKNFIERVCIADCNTSGLGQTFQHQNLSEATIKGVEFKGMLWLDEAMGAPVGTRLNAAVAWTEGTGSMTDADGKVHKGEPLNSIAPLKAVLGLGYDAPTDMWGSELMWTLVAAKKSSDISNVDSGTNPDEPGGEQFATPGYGLVDLTAYYKPHKDVTINAGIFNITDKKYWAWDDVRGISGSYVGLNRYTQPGRNASVSVKWEI